MEAAAAASLLSLPPREELRRPRSESEFHRRGRRRWRCSPVFWEGKNSVCEHNFCKVAKLSFGLWAGRCGGSNGGRGILEKRKEREGASPVPAAREGEGGRRGGRGRREREGELVMTGNRRWSWALSLHIGPSLLSCSLPPSCSREQSTRRERVRTKCIANRSIRLGQKGERRSSPPFSSSRHRAKGGRRAFCRVTRRAARPPTKNLSLDKKRKARWLRRPRRLGLFGMGAEQVLKLHRVARMVSCVCGGTLYYDAL